MRHLDNHTKQLLSDPAKRRAWIIYKVNLQGRSLADVAREAGVTRQALYHSLRIPYPRMEKALADALGLTPAQLFPERYDADGIPNRQRGRRRKSATKATHKQHTAPTKARNTRTSEVA